MEPTITIHPQGIELRWGGLQAWVEGRTVQFAHAGCKVLGTLKNIPDDLARGWGAEDRIRLAAAAVLLAQARGRLAAFYCVDPYIPGYGRARELLSAVPYAQRSWAAGLREDGCHRVVLAEETTRFFRDRGVAVRL